MNETIETIETISPLITLDGLLSQKVLQDSKADFLTFVKQTAPTLVSDWKMGKHIEVISEKLKQLESGEIKRLMVFLPPRSSKSVICSKLFPAWYIGRNPEHEILTISHSDQLSSDFGRSVRDIVNTENFQDIFYRLSYLVKNKVKITNVTINLHKDLFAQKKFDGVHLDRIIPYYPLQVLLKRIAKTGFSYEICIPVVFFISLRISLISCPLIGSPRVKQYS